MEIAEIVGLLGGALTTFGMVPQAVRIFKLKSAKEISLYFLLSFIIGVGLWITYGILLRLPPVIFWNAVSLVLLLSLLYAKLKYGRDKK